jgi:hypothetical protein
MKKRIDIGGQRVELYSTDEGRTWSSSPQSIVAYGQRKELLRTELKQRFARIDAMQEPDAYGDFGYEMPSRFTRR